MAPSGVATLTGVKPSCFGRIRCADGECMPTTAAATAVRDTRSTVHDTRSTVHDTHSTVHDTCCTVHGTVYSAWHTQYSA